MFPPAVGKDRYKNRVAKALDVITDPYIIETFKIERIDSRYLSRVVKECFEEEIDIILNWAKHFRDRGIAYIITRRQENSGHVYSIWKEWKEYRAKSLIKEGWKIKE